MCNLGDTAVKCYLWHEGAGGRGSSEIATCINSFINSLPDSVKHLVLFSNACGGHNRNQNFIAMCLRAVVDGKLDILEHV